VHAVNGRSVYHRVHINSVFIFIRRLASGNDSDDGKSIKRMHIIIIISSSSSKHLRGGVVGITGTGLCYLLARRHGRHLCQQSALAVLLNSLY